jgi:hypothetical protein
VIIRDPPPHQRAPRRRRAREHARPVRVGHRPRLRLMPHASPHQANRIAQTLALLPDDGRALLDPRSLASHESESRPTIPTPFAHGMIPMIRVEIRSLRQCGASPPSLSQQTPT